MKEVKLIRGGVALVDDEDFEYLNQFKWYLKKKQGREYAGTYFEMHTLIMKQLKPEIKKPLNCKENLLILIFLYNFISFSS